jgi:phosphatidylserine/phosphatidylglycerophosphate/cardiolipin synthase-like enzyme
MSDDMGKVSKEALLALSRYLPAKHQSKAANDVFLSVDSAFRTLERQLAEARAALMDCIFIIELKYRNTDEIANAVLKQARNAINERINTDDNGDRQ